VRGRDGWIDITGIDDIEILIKSDEPRALDQRAGLHRAAAWMVEFG
jgi:hypothetical protein